MRDGGIKKVRDGGTSKMKIALVYTTDFAMWRLRAGLIRTLVEEEYAFFKDSLDRTIKEETDEQKYNAALQELTDKYGYEEARRAAKNPIVMEMLVKKLSEIGMYSTTLDQIVNNIAKMAQAANRRVRG